VPETQPVSWRSSVYSTPVISSHNVRVGVVCEVLGSDAEEVFHGLRVALTGRKRDVIVSANDSASVSTRKSARPSRNHGSTAFRPTTRRRPSTLRRSAGYASTSAGAGREERRGARLILDRHPARGFAGSPHLARDERLANGSSAPATLVQVLREYEGREPGWRPSFVAAR
jgi:hypothetical protein